MFHFFKYFILTLFFFAVLNLFRSNLDTMESVRFQIPFILDWSSPPIALNYLLLVSFCVGMLLAAFIGAFRFTTIRSKSKEVKKLRKELEERSASFSSTEEETAKTERLPPLAD